MKAPPEAPRFFTDQAMSVGDELALEPPVARHMLSALRLKPGAAVRLFNGHGGEYQATIEQTDRRSVRVRLDAFDNVERESPLSVHLGLCVSRGDRMDFALQKSTELGVRYITPLFSERTELRLDAKRQQKKHRHWQQIVISACEQCGRNRLPSLSSVDVANTWVTQVQAALKLVLHHRSERGMHLPGTPPASVALLIGPEGGLTDAEVALAQQHGFDGIALGPRVLRTETAPVAALSLLQHFWGDIT
ncbi:MAG: 16S rRNA (uracil(1498)-N(3))-methyltransferase [Pseudomonadota bacterium]